MAKEITGKLVLNAVKGGAKISRSESFTIDMTGNSFSSGVQSIPNSGGEALVEADELGTAGYVFVKNLDSTNYVTLGSHASSNHTIKLKAGESTIFRAAGTVYGLANTAACNVEYIIIED